MYVGTNVGSTIPGMFRILQHLTFIRHWLFQLSFHYIVVILFHSNLHQCPMFLHFYISILQSHINLATYVIMQYKPHKPITIIPTSNELGWLVVLITHFPCPLVPINWFVIPYKPIRLLSRQSSSTSIVRHFNLACSVIAQLTHRFSSLQHKAVNTGTTNVGVPWISNGWTFNPIYT